jgi:hypothetical protein
MSRLALVSGYFTPIVAASVAKETDIPYVPASTVRQADIAAAAAAASGHRNMGGTQHQTHGGLLREAPN